MDELIRGASPASFKTQIRLVREPASEIPVQVSASPTTLGGTEARTLILTDLSERKRLEEIAAAERLSRAILEQTQEAIALCIDGCIVRANRALYGICGSVPLMQPFDLVFPLRMPDSGMFSAAMPETGKTIQNQEVRYHRPDGKIFDMILSAGPLVGKGNKILGSLISIVDISERKQAEENLRRSEARFRLLSETSARLLAADDPQGLIDGLCRRVMDHLDCQAFFNFMVDERSGRLRLNACAGIPEEQIRKLEWLDYGVAVCGCVARDEVRIIAEDIFHTTDSRTELVKSYGIQAYCCHPLKAQDRLIGTLSFGTKTRTSFTADEVELMRIVADQVAVAMQRIQDQRLLEERVSDRTAEIMLLLEEVEQSRDALRRLASELVLTEERERKRIAVAMHDEIAQTLAAAKMRLDLLKSVTDPGESRRVVEEAGSLLGQAIRETRSLMTDISSPVLYDMGLPSAVQAFAEQMSASRGIPIAYSFDGELGDLQTEIGVTIYQVARELLQNIAKHSLARSASIRFTRENESVRAVVADDGRGFDAGDLLFPKGEGGFGLFSIRERVKSFDGSLQIETAPGKGTVVTVTLPVRMRKDKETPRGQEPTREGRKKRKS
jgi:PAS domain S-box-containing protein